MQVYATMSAQQARGTVAPVQRRQGTSPRPFLLSTGGNSNARLGACSGGTAGAAGIAAVPAGTKGLCFSALFNVAKRSKCWASQ